MEILLWGIFWLICIFSCFKYILRACFNTPLWIIFPSTINDAFDDYEVIWNDETFLKYTPANHIIWLVLKVHTRKISVVTGMCYIQSTGDSLGPKLTCLDLEVTGSKSVFKASKNICKQWTCGEILPFTRMFLHITCILKISIIGKILQISLNGRILVIIIFFKYLISHCLIGSVPYVNSCFIACQRLICCINFTLWEIGIWPNVWLYDLVSKIKAGSWKMLSCCILQWQNNYNTHLQNSPNQ